MRLPARRLRTRGEGAQDARQEEEEEQHQRQAGIETPTSQAPRAATSRAAAGGAMPRRKSLERFDVGHHPGQEVTRAVLHQARRCEGLDGLVEPNAQPGEEPESNIVGARRSR